MLPSIGRRAFSSTAAGVVLTAAACTVASEADTTRPTAAVETAVTQDPPIPAAAAASTVSPEAVVQAQLVAYNARDIDAFMATFHPDAELFVLGDPSPRAAGRAAVRAIYTELFSHSPELHSTVLHRAVVGNRVVDHERITGRKGADALEIVMVY